MSPSFLPFYKDFNGILNGQVCNGYIPTRNSNSLMLANIVDIIKN